MSNQTEAQAQIDRVLRRAVEAREVPGVVALAASDKGAIYEGAFGVRDLGAGGAMTLDTVFRIASMTKAITSVAAMQLVERGKLTLDKPVPAIDPDHVPALYVAAEVVTAAAGMVESIL